MSKNIQEKADRSRVLKKIKTLMTGSEKSGILSLGSILSMVAAAYGGMVKLRASLYKKNILSSKRLPCFIISIGNLTVGGTGKTPMTIAVAEIVQRLGLKAAVISRGYKGSLEKTGACVSDGKKLFLDADIAGDEPFMMATALKDIPVVVGRDRFEAGMIAVKGFRPDVLVLDDAFQHLRLSRDIDLILLDSLQPFGNGHLLPRGTLREPASALLRADAIVFTRSNRALDSDGSSLEKKLAIPINKPVFRSCHTPYIVRFVKAGTNLNHGPSKISDEFDLNFLKRRRVFAFSGIAKNEDFQRTLEDLECKPAGFYGYPDHHPYSNRDLDRIYRAARDGNADLLVTTEKDYVRIATRVNWPMNLVVLGVRISFGKDRDAFERFIRDRLNGLIADSDRLQGGLL